MKSSTIDQSTEKEPKAEETEEERKAQAELRAIHPSIRGKVFSGVSGDVLTAMSCVEKLAFVKERQAGVENDDIPDFAKHFVPKHATIDPSTEKEPKAEETEEEQKAQAILRLIHPSIKGQVFSGVPQDVVTAMSCVEKLAFVMERQADVKVDQIPDFGKDTMLPRVGTVAAHLASCICSPLSPEKWRKTGSGIARPSTSDESKAEGEQEAPTKKYWAPVRCPYGMDTGSWVISQEELQQHNSTDSCWISIDGQVYDVTAWLAQHPGGAQNILKYAGGDASKGFHSVSHSPNARRYLKKFKRGSLVGVPLIDELPGEDEANYQAEGREKVATIFQGLMDDMRAEQEQRIQGENTNVADQLAARKLCSIDPRIRAQISRTIDHDKWLEMSSVQKLAFVEDKMKTLDEKFLSELDDSFGILSSEVPDVQESANKKDAKMDIKPEVCPISGKSGTGECPMGYTMKNMPAPSAPGLKEKMAQKKALMKDSGEGSGKGSGKGGKKGDEGCPVS